jgi:hypothetical protein
MFLVSKHVPVRQLLRTGLAALCLTLWLPGQADVRYEVLVQPTGFAQCPQFFAEGQLLQLELSIRRLSSCFLGLLAAACDSSPTSALWHIGAGQCEWRR